MLEEKTFEEEDNKSFYNNQELDDLEEGDEITSEERGFMQGYMEEE